MALGQVIYEILYRRRYTKLGGIGETNAATIFHSVDKVVRHYILKHIFQYKLLLFYKFILVQ